MGWLFKPGSLRRDLIAERTKGWERTNADGMTVKTKRLAHCYRGGAFSGVLWTVWERAFEKNGEQVQPTERWIGCDLLEYSKGVEGWGYKDLDESMHPYFYSCPLSYLKMVPVVTNEEWRQSVRGYHERQLAKRQAKKRERARA